MSRCTGHCCKSFWLPYSPMELNFQRRLAKANKSKHNSEEMLKVSDMVIYLRPKENGKGHWYTCKHYDKVSGNCTDYENRPKMCSDYPYGGKCQYKGCTMKPNCAEDAIKEVLEKEKVA